MYKYFINILLIIIICISLTSCYNNGGYHHRQTPSYQKILTAETSSVQRSKHLPHLRHTDQVTFNKRRKYKLHENNQYLSMLPTIDPIFYPFLGHHLRHHGEITQRTFRSLQEEETLIDLPAVEPPLLNHQGLWPVKKEAVVEGNIVLGGLMMVHEREDSITCGPIMPQGGVQALETMLYTLDRINANPKLLPNITIGAHILDDCDKDTYGLEMAVDFIKGKNIYMDLFAGFLFSRKFIEIRHNLIVFDLFLKLHTFHKASVV